MNFKQSNLIFIEGAPLNAQIVLHLIKCSQPLREGEAAEINRAWLRKPWSCLPWEVEHLRREVVSPSWHTKCSGALEWLEADKEFK